MARDLARLKLRVEGDTAKLQSDLKVVELRAKKTGSKMSKAFNRASRSLGTFTRRATSARSAMVALAGAAALGLAVKRSIEFADKIAKTARAIGITTDALQELRFAADLSGVSQEKLDKGLLKFTKNIGELGRSSSETQTSLKDLAPALLEDLRATKSTSDALFVVFRALGGMTSQTRKAAVASALFGRSGITLTNIVSNGADAVDKMAKQAHDLGIVIDKNLFDKVESANDQLTRMGDIFKVAGVNISLQLLPAVEKLADIFTDPKFLAGIGNISDEIAKFIATIAQNQRAFAAISAGLLTAQLTPGPPSVKALAGLGVGITVFEKLDTEAAKAGREIDTLNIKLGDLRRLEAAGRKRLFVATGPTGETGPLIADRIKQLEEQRALLQTRRAELTIPGRGGRRAPARSLALGTRSSAGGGRSGTVDPRIKADAERIAKAIADLNFETDKLDGRFSALAPGTADLARSLGLLKDGFIATGTGISAITSPALRELDDAQRRLNDSQERSKAKTDAAAQAQKRLADAAKSAADAQRRGVEAAQEFGFAISGALEDAVIQGNSLTDVLRGLEQEITRIVFQRAIGDPLNNFIGNLLGPVFGSSKGNVFAGGNVVPFSRGGIPDVGSRPAIFPMASGGFGSLREFGKPEAILPLTRLPGGDLGVRAQGGGGNNFFNINISVSGGGGGGGQNTALAGQIATAVQRGVLEIVDQKIAKERRSGGVFGPGLRR